MILIFSRDADTISSIARNQANAPQAVFGRTDAVFQTVQTVGPRENLFIIAEAAKNGTNWWPVIGDEATNTYWTAPQAMTALAAAVPQNFGGNVYLAACAPAAPNASLVFARAFQAELAKQRRTAGKVFAHADAVRGPIPPPSDARWVEAQAA